MGSVGPTDDGDVAYDDDDAAISSPPSAHSAVKPSGQTLLRRLASSSHDESGWRPVGVPQGPRIDLGFIEGCFNGWSHG